MGSAFILYKILTSDNVNTLEVFFRACREGPGSSDCTAIRVYAGTFLIIKCLDFADKMKYTTIMLMFRSLHIFANLNTFRELDTSYIKKLWQDLN